MSKLEARQVTLNEEEVDLPSLIRDSVKLVELEAKKSNIVNSTSFDRRAEVIRGDTRRAAKNLTLMLVEVLSRKSTLVSTERTPPGPKPLMPSIP